MTVLVTQGIAGNIASDTLSCRHCCWQKRFEDANELLVILLAISRQ